MAKLFREGITEGTDIICSSLNRVPRKLGETCNYLFPRNENKKKKKKEKEPFIFPCKRIVSRFEFHINPSWGRDRSTAFHLH